MKSKTINILCIVIILLMVTGTQNIFAQNPTDSSGDLSVEFIADEKGSFFVFNDSGQLITDLDSAAIVKKGWIVQTLESAIELETAGIGTLVIAPNSIVSFDSIGLEEASILLLRGRMRILYESSTYLLSLETPVAVYKITNTGEYVLISEDTEDFYAVGGSEASVTNRISGQESTVTEMTVYNPLDRREPQKEISAEIAESLLEIVPERAVEFPVVEVAAVPEPEADVAVELTTDEPTDEEIPIVVAAAVEEVPADPEPVDPSTPDLDELAPEESEEAVVIVAEEEIPVIAVPEIEEGTDSEESVVPASLERLVPTTPVVIVEEIVEDVVEAAAVPEPEAVEILEEPVETIAADEPEIIIPEIEDTEVLTATDTEPSAEPDSVLEEPTVLAILPQPVDVTEPVLAAEEEAEEETAEPLAVVVEDTVDAVIDEAEPVVIAESEAVIEAIDAAADSTEIIEEPITIAVEPTEIADISIEESDEDPIGSIEETVPVETEPIDTAVELTVVTAEAAPTETPVDSETEDSEEEAEPAVQEIVISEPAPIISSAVGSSEEITEQAVLNGGVVIESSSVNSFETQEYEESYIRLAVSPWISYGDFSAGLTFPLMFVDYPFSISNWYLPRGNNPYDFGTGYSTSFADLINPISNFTASRDFYLDILSLIGFASYESPNGSFQVNADDSTLLSLGTGVLIPELNPAIDDPFIRRVGLSNTLTTNYFDYELLVNDLTHAELFALRMAGKPAGENYPLEIGLYGLFDLALSPNSYMIVPGIDLTVPIAYSEVLALSFYADFSVLMLADNAGFHTESFYSDGSFYNYLAAIGFEGKSGNVEFGLSGAYRDGALDLGMFGYDYQWRRTAMHELLFDDADYTYGKDVAADWIVLAEIGYDGELFDTNLGYRFNFDANFGVSSWDTDRDELSFSAAYAHDDLTVGLGMRKRGFAESVSNVAGWNLQDFLFNEDTQFFAGAAYTAGAVTFSAELSGSAQYQDPDESSVLNNVDNLYTDSGALVISPTLSIGSSIALGQINGKILEDTTDTAAPEDSESSSHFHLNSGFDIFHPFYSGITNVYGGPYTALSLEPYYSSENISFGLMLDLAFSGNPFSISNWYLPRGNNPYDFGTGYSTSFADLINPISNFTASRDFYLDILSLIGFASYQSPNGSFQVNADDSTLLSLGTGVLIPELNPAIDDPFIRRVGLSNTLTTNYFDYELLVNDLTHAELFALRMAGKPAGENYPLEIGLYGLFDLALSPNSYMIVPGIDLTVPIAYSEVLALSFYADFSVLMLADNAGFHTESFYSDGSFYNYLAAIGFEGKSGNVEFGLSGAYRDGALDLGMFGYDYQWRRTAMHELLFDDADYTYGKDVAADWIVLAEIGYDGELFDTNLGYRFNFDANFGVSSWDTDRDELSFSAAYAHDDLTVGLGMRKRGFAESVSNVAGWNLQDFLFNEDTQFFAGAAYTAGAVTFSAELSGSAQYQDPDESSVLNNVDNLYTDSGALVISPTLSIGSSIALF